MGVCFQWRDTRSCKFGDACRFSHDGQPPANFSSFSGQRGVCRNFRDTGECKFGDVCKYSHEVPKEDGKFQNSVSTITTSLVSNSTGVLSSTLSGLTTANNTTSALSIQGVGLQFGSSAQLGSQQPNSLQSQGNTNLGSVMSNNLISNTQGSSNGEYFDSGNVDADDENA